MITRDTEYLLQAQALTEGLRIGAKAIIGRKVARGTSPTTVFHQTTTQL